jgi:hypothetical protein
MAASPKQTAIFLQFLHHFKDHTLPYNVKFQHKPQQFNTHFCNPEDTNLTLFLTNSRRIVAKVSQFCCSSLSSDFGFDQQIPTESFPTGWDCHCAMYA